MSQTKEVEETKTHFIMFNTLFRKSCSSEDVAGCGQGVKAEMRHLIQYDPYASPAG